MKVYKFPFEQRSVSRGYVSIVVNNGEAQIDPKNEDQVALAEELGGKEVAAKKNRKPEKAGGK